LKKLCSIYKTPDAYKIITLSKVDKEFFLSSEPVFIIQLEDSKQVIWDALISSLNESVEKPDFNVLDISDYQKQVCVALDETSYGKLYKRSKGCELEWDDANNVIKISPLVYRMAGIPDAGMIPNQKETIQLDFSGDYSEEVLQAVMDFLDRPKK